MDPLIIGLVGFGAVFLLILMGVHVGLALAVVGVGGTSLMLGSTKLGMELLTTTPYVQAQEYFLTTMPLFALMGTLATHAGIGESIYGAVYKWLDRLPGGLCIATVGACAMLGATTSSSMVPAMVFSKLSLPEMRRLGYDMKLSCGTIAAGGILGMVIPPSVLMIVYSMLTGASLGKLFIAGILPGILIAAGFSAVIYGLVRRNPQLAPRPPIYASWTERVRSLKDLWMLLVIILIVLGGIYSGVFTPTEAGGVGCFSVLVIGVLRRRLTWKKIIDGLTDAAQTTAVLFLMLIGALLLSRFLVFAGVTARLTQFVVGLGLPPLLFVAAFMVVEVLLGCFLGGTVIFSITLPMIFPIVKGMGLDPVWFGIVALVTVETGLLTPPVGMNVYIVKSVAGESVSLEDIFAGSMPFLVVLIVIAVILLLLPDISLVLPNMMMKTR